jgi:hypothetical protein
MGAPLALNLCVLRSGGDFLPEHVQRLARQVPDLVCLSDVPVDDVKTLPLKYAWPGWWAKMEIYRPDIKGDVFYIDLDTLVIKMPEMPDRTTVLTDFGDSKVIGSGLMYLTEKDRAVIWNAFIENPDKAMAAHLKWPAGDQGFILPYVKNAQRWQHIARVYSYKQHCLKGIPENAHIVCFHGKPRPWSLNL